MYLFYLFSIVYFILYYTKLNYKLYNPNYRISTRYYILISVYSKMTMKIILKTTEKKKILEVGITFVWPF